MALRPLQVCTYPGCRALVRASRCEQHTRKRPAKQGTDPFYLSAAWRALRAQHIAASPLCLDCLDAGRTEPAVIVDHVVERRDRPDLELDPSNLRSLCFRCHSAKTAREQWRRRRGDSTPPG